MDYKKLLNTSLDRFGAPKAWSLALGGEKYVKDFTLKEQTADRLVYENGALRLITELEIFENGVVIRRDHVENISDNTVILNKLGSVFEFEGGEYDVYSQYSCWQREGEGAWTPLHTQVVSESLGIRTCDGAAPVMALSNRQNGKITVFHLVPNCQWRLRAARQPMFDYKYDKVILEAGFADTALEFGLCAGESVSLPEVVFFEAESKTDLDAYKLHDVWNSLYPRRKMPVMYNTWLLKFDRIDIDNILRQAKTAAQLGTEMFLIDAGWFGTGENWGDFIGDWRENQVCGYKGRVKEVSDYVRSLGMSFGMWLEPERAFKSTPINKEHPEYFIAESFLDFSNPDALRYITELTCKLIETYNLGFMKFDFNDTIPYDPAKCGFYKYYEGQRKYVSALKERYPELYITNCASGGYRIDLANAKLFDSFWISDNQGPLEGNDIYCGHIMRMPPSSIEKWNVFTFCEGFPEYGREKLRAMPISCNDGTWDELVYVKENYTLGFSSGSPLGFSCDIAAFPDDFKERLKAFIEKYKKDRDFYISANARILCNTDFIKVLQYSSRSLDKIAIYCFTRHIRQNQLTVYPRLDPSRDYRLDGEILSGKEILEKGIVFGRLFENECLVKELEAL